MLVGWSVRVKGSANAIYDYLSGWIDPILETNAAVEGFSEEDMPILNITVDKARFPTGHELIFHHLGGRVFNAFTMTEAYARTLDLDKIAADFMKIWNGMWVRDRLK